jgi:FkbM family methyltransferase
MSAALRARYRAGPYVSALREIERRTRASAVPGAWRLGRLARRLYPDRDVICRTASGFELIVNPAGDPYQRTLFETGAYEPGTLALIARLLGPGDAYFDVGANIGLMTLAAAHAVGPGGSVVAFEPHPRIFARLVENLALNGAGNALALPVALGATSAERELYAFPGVNIGRASLVAATGGVPCGAVAVRALDAVIAEKRLRPPRLMKLDVEGFELDVLRGAAALLRSAACPVLCVEADDEMPREGAAGGMAAIHEFVMAQQPFRAFRFVGTKFAASKLRPIAGIAEVPRHDNVVYVPFARLASIPADVFA